MKQHELTYEWHATLVTRGKMRRALRYAGLRWTEEKRGLFGSTFTLTGNAVQIYCALAVFNA